MDARARASAVAARALAAIRRAWGERFMRTSSIPRDGPGSGSRKQGCGRASWEPRFYRITGLLRDLIEEGLHQPIHRLPA
jgi:hypothetical protein